MSAMAAGVDAGALARALSGDPSGIGGRQPSGVAEAADEHGVAALLWEALASTGAAGSGLRTELDARVRADATRDLFVQAEMRRVLEAIAASGGRVVIFKGSALAYTVYSHPWHRPRTDTDLLTSPEGMDTVSRALESCGYARSDELTSGQHVSHQVAFDRVDAHGLRHVVDLHWKIVNPQLLADVLPFEDVWAGSQAAPALGPAARVPSHVASIVLACVHRLAHHQGQDRLIWLHDLALLASRLGREEWTALCDLAISRGVAAICLDGLSRAREAFATPLPADVVARLEAAGRAEPSRRYVDGAVRRRDVLVSDLAVLGTWSARLRLIREHAFPPASFILKRYGLRSPLWLPALYAHRLVTGAWKWARRR
jgi:hypothetical protein